MFSSSFFPCSLCPSLPKPVAGQPYGNNLGKQWNSCWPMGSSAARSRCTTWSHPFPPSRHWRPFAWIIPVDLGAWALMCQSWSASTFACCLFHSWLASTLKLLFLFVPSLEALVPCWRFWMFSSTMQTLTLRCPKSGRHTLPESNCAMMMWNSVSTSLSSHCSSWFVLHFHRFDWSGSTECWQCSCNNCPPSIAIGQCKCCALWTRCWAAESSRWCATWSCRTVKAADHSPACRDHMEF